MGNEEVVDDHPIFLATVPAVTSDRACPDHGN